MTLSILFRSPETGKDSFSFVSVIKKINDTISEVSHACLFIVDATFNLSSCFNL